MVAFESLGTVFYSPSIVTMALSCIVCEIKRVIAKLIYPTCIYRPRRVNFVKMFDADKTRMIGLPYGEKNMKIC